MPKRKALSWESSREYRGEPVGEDPELSPEEKETVLAFNKGADRVVVSSWEAAVVRRLLALPHFELSRVLLRRGKVVFAEGTIPVGALKVLAVPRATASHAEIVARTPSPKAPRIRSGASLVGKEEAPGGEGRGLTSRPGAKGKCGALSGGRAEPVPLFRGGDR